MSETSEATTGAPPGVDLEVLATWFETHVEGAQGAPLRAEVISGGRSNLTYHVTDGDRDWVLRRPPLGHVLATAHDMAREHRVLSALVDTDVPVPRPVAFCDDETVIGAPFYVMEKVDGVILRAPEDVARLSALEARRCSQELVEVLATLHAIDYETVGLADFGRPDGYLARQVERWVKQWDGNATRELPQIDELTRRLRAAVPEQSGSAIVHGDYRLDNTMLAPEDPGRVVAVLDWEMATLGDPLADLGLLLVYWGGEGGRLLPAVESVSTHPGFYDRDELVEAYAAASGRNVDTLDFYVVLAYFKLAVIIEGIHARYLKGQTVGTGFEHVGLGVPILADAALEVASRSTIPGLRG